MQKTLPAWACVALSIIGAVLVGSMLMSWVDVGTVKATGFRLAWHETHWLLLVPASGALLFAAAMSRSRYTRLAAIFAGVVVAGDVLFDLAHSIIRSGLDTWLILGGAGVMLAGSGNRMSWRRAWRAVGGIAILVGFFAPWATVSLWQVMTHEHVRTLNVLWAIPAAGIAGVIAAVIARGGALAGAAGVAVYGALLYVIGALASLVFGPGAWLALGASAAALAIGLLAGAPARSSAALVKTR